MNTYYKEILWDDDVKFHLSYTSVFKSYSTEMTILVDSSYVERMQEFLSDFGFEQLESIREEE